MQTLLAMTDDMLAIEQQLEAGDGVMTDEQAAALDKLLADIDQKADNYAALIRSLELRATARRAALEGLKKLISSDERSADFLTERLKMAMEKLGRKKMETERFRITVANNGGKVPLEIYDETLIPDKFMIPQPAKIDNDGIRQAIEAGEDIPGAKLGQRGTSLRIK